MPNKFFMKYTILILLVFIFSCGDEKKLDVNYFIFGEDTVITTGDINIDVSKCRATSGHNDTITGIFTTRINGKPLKDTVYIHDTIYTSLHIDKVNTINQ